MTFLQLNHLSHQYFCKQGLIKTLDDITLSIPEGSFVSFLGPSGCGKSTLLSIIAGVIAPTHGDVKLNDTAITNPSFKIGYMLQQDYLFPWKTILDNVLIGPKVQQKKSYKQKACKEKAIKLLEDIGLASVIYSYPENLSNGMRQRAALIRTFITDPQLLLLDEPFSALDLQTKIKLEILVSNMLKTQNNTSILVTHDIGEAISMSDKIYLMKTNPGAIHRCIEIPIEIRNLSPLQSRKHLKYQHLFDRIWEELNTLETGSLVK